MTQPVVSMLRWNGRQRVSRLQLFNHLAAWPLWPIRLHWVQRTYDDSAFGAVHWVEQGREDSGGRTVWSTTVHLGRLKVIVGSTS
jgi:hypothetical protein